MMQLPADGFEGEVNPALARLYEMQARIEDAIRSGDDLRGSFEVIEGNFESTFFDDDPNEASWGNIRVLIPGFKQALPPNDLRLRFDELTVVRDVAGYSEGVRLTKAEAGMVAALAIDPGKAVSREEIIERVWETDFTDDYRKIDVHMRRIREKMGSRPSDESAFIFTGGLLGVNINTARGLGYFLTEEQSV